MSTSTNRALPAWPVHHGHVSSDVVDSTLDEAARHAARYPNPVWFTAAEQTHSRGRRGRKWVSPRGNFFGTLALPVSEPDRAALRSFVAALALFDALEAVTAGSVALELKWPNDVLLNGGKVAGILLESLTESGRIWGVAIGIGVNLIAAPDPTQVESDAVRPVSVLGETGAHVAPETFLTHLAPAFARWEETFQTAGFSAIRNAWLARAGHLGRAIRVRLPNETLDGLFEDVDQDGNLVLAMTGGNRRIAAGDVYFGG